MTLFEDAPALTSHVFKIKGKKLWTLTQEYYDELKVTYPLKDVEREMRAAKLWCKNVSASKRKTAVGMNRFLAGWVSRSESDGHVTVDSEKSMSEMIYDKNLKGHIAQWSGIIHERTPGELKANKMFMAASQYPEFAKWALEQKPELKGAKADKVVSPEISTKPVVATETDLASHKPKKPAIKRLVMPSKRKPEPTWTDKAKSHIQDVKQAKADGTIEGFVRKAGLF